MSATLRDEIVSALERGAFNDLTAIVLKHKDAGVGQRATYDVLESIRAELARINENDDPQRDAIEGLMDRVWGWCAQKDMIWSSSLSDEKVNH
jgi:hypothetical protein